MVQQAIPYSYDKDTAPNHAEEYPRYPIETLYDKTGDCECKAMLSSALLNSLNYQTALLFFPGHVALGIHLDMDYPGSYYSIDRYKFYYYETTAEGWSFGAIPREFMDIEPEIVVINRDDLKFITEDTNKSIQ